MHSTSSKPYLIRALYEWCIDFGYTPYLVTHVDDNVHIPMQFRQQDQITFNISPDATHQLLIKNDWIEFTARFGGIPHKIDIPIGHVLGIYAQENAQGLDFPFSPFEDFEEKPDILRTEETTGASSTPGLRPNTKKPQKPDEKKGSHLKIIK